MHPLDAPGALWVLSRVGKYLVRPQAGETSHKEQFPCGRQGKVPSLLSCCAGFRLCGGDQRAFRSPFGNLRALCCAWGIPQKTDSLWQAGKKAFLAFSCFAESFASAEATRGLSARPLDPFGGLSFFAVIFLFHLRKHQWPPLFTERPQALSPSLWTPRAAFQRVSSTLPPGASAPAPGRTAPG